MWGKYKFLDIVIGPLGDGSNIIRDHEGNLDIGNIVGLSLLIFFVIVLSVLIIRKIRRGM